MCAILSFLYQSNDTYEMKTENIRVYILEVRLCVQLLMYRLLSIDATSYRDFLSS